MKSKAFTLMEMVAVVIIVMILVSITAVAFGNARPSVRVKNDAAQMVSFLRNMWDRTRATGAPLILNPDYEKGKLSYFDPREAKEFFAEFESGARIIGIRLNDRFYTRDTYIPPVTRELDADGKPMATSDEPYYGDEDVGDTLYISEGRGLTYVGVVFALYKEEDDPSQLEHITMATINLITGRGDINQLEQEDLDDLMLRAGEGMSDAPAR